MSNRLLLVDDDKVSRGIAARTLRHAGFDVSEAGSGEDALALFAENPYDLVLLDLMMPGLDGYEVCWRLREAPRGARVPILILTGLNDTESIELAYRQGATDFITKPINWTLLSHRVRYALRASAAAEVIRRSRESLSRAQSLAGMGSWATTFDGRMDCSAELLRIFGATADEERCSSAEGFLDLVVTGDRTRVAKARRHLAAEGVPYQLEFQVLRGDGAIRTVFEQAVPLLDDQGRAVGIEGITQDVTERVQAQERIRQLAYYDDATGLPNWQFFEVLAVPSLERADRNRASCALMHVDIDRFRGVNDAFGRAQGDAVLKIVAERLRLWIRGGDIAAAGRAPADQGVLARVGGNSFILLITDLAGQEQATIVAQRLLRVIAQPIALEGQALVLTASIGVAFYPNDAWDLPRLARCAEQAVHAAKDAGRAQHRYFDEQMNAHAASRLRLEAELRHAIGQGDLRLHFQPKVDASNGAIVGAEALVRWQHPERGLLPPTEFIALAEETGLILPLTDWVLESACQRLREWADLGLPPARLSVNLAASSLTGTALIGKLDALMDRFDLEPECLTLEMTETMLMRDTAAAVVLLDALHARGFGLSLDDFGTGYSSLSYLKRFPVDELKIDRAFVTDATLGGRDSTLAAAIIALGRELGLQVVAEGVETAAQSAFLLQRGCNIQQGYLFSRPVPAAELELMLRLGTLVCAVTDVTAA